MKTILVVEDEQYLAKLVAFNLENDGNCKSGQYFITLKGSAPARKVTAEYGN